MTWRVSRTDEVIAMEAFICVTCGTQYSASATPPKACAICDEERQYVLPTGQAWTTLAKLNMTHMATFREEAGVLGIGTSPHFGIGQRALLVKSPDGNVLWDCISLLSPAIVDIIKALGGLAAIAISHPHYYTTMVEWSRAFGGIPVYLNAADRQWVMRTDPCLKLWGGDTLELAPGLTLIRTGRRAPEGAGRCCRATSCRSSQTASMSRSCTAIRTSSRSAPRRCAPSTR